MEKKSLGEFSPSPPTWHQLSSESFVEEKGDSYTAEDYYLSFQQLCGSWKI